MSPEAQNRAVAEACGWREAFPTDGPAHPETRKGGILLPYKWVNETTHERRITLPDYGKDLNAMADAEQILTRNQLPAYQGWIYNVTGVEVLSILAEDFQKLIAAKAVHRREAFVRAIGAWIDDTPAQDPPQPAAGRQEAGL